MKIQKQSIIFVVGVSLVYCSLSAGFSLVGIVLPDKMILPNPIASLSVNEIAGHFVWGAVAGIVTLKLRYILLGGLLAVLIDSDHLVARLHVEAIPRMSHSITFAIISMIVMMLIFHNKDYRLGAIVATSVLTHISYDMFDSEYGFPIFSPFLNKIIQFPQTDWLVFEIAAIVIVGIVSFFVTRKESEKIIKNDSGR